MPPISPSLQPQQPTTFSNQQTNGIARQQDSTQQFTTIPIPPPAVSYIPNALAAPYAMAVNFTNRLFRHKTLKTVELTEQGNFVVEIPVPARVKAQSQEREFAYVRYSAVTGDPDEFDSCGFTLRAFDMERNTEIFIVITMYNEDEQLFTKTWKAVVRNISYLCGKRKSKVWGAEGWKKVVVCVVADGRTKIHRTTLAVLGILGAYQEGVIKTSVNNQSVSAHLFEITTQIDPGSLHPTPIPVQLIFCLKEKNQKKINSHRWFFNAFGKCLQPNVCVLLDVGTKPSDKSIFKLWKAFEKNPRVAGACGEIYAERGFGCSRLLNPLVAAQNFEYKISNILDKPFESCFGFISVLPGAFSAYRYAALQNDENGHGPLEKYFIGESMHGGANISKANMYLAEDRILCFELVTKRGQKWILKYVRGARAETDVPDTIADFLCGSAVQNKSTDPFGGYGSYVFIAIREVYLIAIVLVFVSSLGNRPQGSKTLYFCCFLLFAIIMILMLYVTGYTMFQALQKTQLTRSNFFDLLRNPTVVNLVNLKRLNLVCNLHDVSWGTKGDTAPPMDIAPIHTKPTGQGHSVVTTDLPENQTDIDALYETFLQTVTSTSTSKEKKKVVKDPKQAQEDFFRLFRTRVVLFWMGTNAFLITSLTTPELVGGNVATINKRRKFVADGVFFAELNSFLTKELAEEGYSGVEVRVTPTRTEIIIRATRTQNVLGEKGRRIRELTSLVQKRFNFPENTVELYAEKVNNRGLCAIAQAESLRYKLLRGLAVRRACYGVVRFIMESGAKGCEVVVSGKLRGARAKSMKFVDGFMIHSGRPAVDFIDYATRNVLMRQGMLGIKVKIMLDAANSKAQVKKSLPDNVTILEPKDDDVPIPAPVAPVEPVA
ncbi:Chitin synthase, class 2 [Chytridiales sp. JEL 0842]|nr:Chitin synthase, class 2 [Chytridiales sp. JEL 0842]